MAQCNHHRMYFEKGLLTCAECGMNKTPLSNERRVVIFDDYREKILHDIERIAKDVPEDILADLVQYADYLKWKRK